MTAPCKDCPRREVGCQARCEAYQAFHAERMRICEGQSLDYELYDARSELIARYERRHHLHDRRRRRK